MPDEPPGRRPDPPQRAGRACWSGPRCRRRRRPSCSTTCSPASTPTEALVLVHLQPGRGLRRRGQVPRRRRRAVRAARPAQPGSTWTSSPRTCTCTTRTGPSPTCSRWPAGWTRWSSARARSSARSGTRCATAQDAGHRRPACSATSFQQALRVGKRAHTETGIDRAGRSLVTAGLERGRRRPLGPLAGHRGARRRRRLDERAGRHHARPGGRRPGWSSPTAPSSARERLAAAVGGEAVRSSTRCRPRWRRPTWSSPAPARSGTSWTPRCVTAAVSAAGRTGRWSCSTWPCRATSTRPPTTCPA